LNLKATTASVTAVSQSLTNHIGATTSHTKAQVGLGSVDNTSDANKPISTATQTALNGKIGESEINTSHFTFASNTLSLKTIVEGQIGTGAVSPSKLSTGAPTWTETGQMTFAGNIYADQIIGRESADSLILRADPQSPTPTTGGPQIELYSADRQNNANQIYVKSSYVYFDTIATTPARFAGINPNGPTDAKDLTTKEYVDTSAQTFTPSTYDGEESVTLPNGLIMKFGLLSGVTTTGTTFSFNSAFPTAVISATATGNTTNNITISSNYAGKCAVSNVTTSGMKVWGEPGSSAYWQVIGY